MKRPLTSTWLLLFFGGVALGCSGKPSSPAPGDVNASASPASADERSPAPTSNPTSTAPETPPVTPPDAPVTCDGVRCSEDTFCDLQTVTCVRAPCPPITRCVSGTHPCAATTCAQGSACESHDLEARCVPMPAPPGGSPCGRGTCEAGMVCCNASCGICTPPDGACTQQACD
ncbi:MAG: hypothetical protein KF850_24570 [Labilithrix sp.]|nr:hypothetical protein [Labilithrix sp.]